jgi:hypothetical protein
MTRKIGAVIITLVCIGGSLALIVYGLIGEPYFLALLVLSAVIGLFVFYLDKVQSVNLLKGELILKDVKETHDSVKILAKYIVEVVETSDHAIMLESFDREAQKEALAKLKELAS